EIIILCEAAGFDTIFVETVGVGQSETAVHSMVDFFLLLMLAGAGDELQGIKRGIMEMADAIIINKADGDNLQKARLAKQQYANALHLFPPTESGWVPKVNICSSVTKKGVREVWEIIEEFKILTTENDYFFRKRKEQEMKIMFETIKENFWENFENNQLVKKILPAIEEKVLKGETSSYQGAKELFKMYFNLGL
ncbi:MAG: methylmalonyl Co-A mutase-associated GTPase MeaB, partial [Bacteroidales bacterium]|nr:methylmalonyl Co-A mutase-associated GTPase MeaB [Bacteroidales bacterium]